MCEKGKGRKVPCNEVNVFVIFPPIKSTKMSSLHNFLFFHNMESKHSVPLWKNYDMRATSCASSSTTDFYLKICAAECCISFTCLTRVQLFFQSWINVPSKQESHAANRIKQMQVILFYFFCKLNFIYLFKETFLVLSFHTNKIKDNIEINKTTFKDKKLIAFKNISREET